MPTDPQLDEDLLRSWIGREAVSEEAITPCVADRFNATLGLAKDHDGDAPLGIQWCLSPLAEPTDGLGDDGHPQKGGFLPPVPLARRMWASSELEFPGRLRVGDSVSRASRVQDVMVKSGKSGQLVFVTVAHAYSARGEVQVRERQSIVYRGASRPSLTPSDMPIQADYSRSVTPGEVLLFRYSALTFNAHRIHYDLPYARQQEDYPGLVVHGPLTATLLMHLAEAGSGGRKLATFAFRGVSPAFCGEPITLAGARGEDAHALCARSADGRTIMTADARFKA